MSNFNEQFELSIDVRTKIINFKEDENGTLVLSETLEKLEYVAILYNTSEDVLVSSNACETYDKALECLQEWHELWSETEDVDDFLDNFGLND